MYTHKTNDLDAARRYILNRLRDGSYTTAVLLHQAQDACTAILDLGEDDLETLLLYLHGSGATDVTVFARIGMNLSDAPGDVEATTHEAAIAPHVLLDYLRDLRLRRNIQPSDARHVDANAAPIAALLYLLRSDYVLYIVTNTTNPAYTAYIWGELPVRKLLEHADVTGNASNLVIHRFGWADASSLESVEMDPQFLRSYTSSVRLGDAP